MHRWWEKRGKRARCAVGWREGLGLFLEIWFCYSTVLRGHTNDCSSFCRAIVYSWQVLLDIPHHPRKHKKRKKVMWMNFHVVMYMQFVFVVDVPML
jgi:hypothetical protein